MADINWEKLIRIYATMTRKPYDDDFFGIEYVSSSSNQEVEQRQESRDEHPDEDTHRKSTKEVAEHTKRIEAFIHQKHLSIETLREDLTAKVDNKKSREELSESALKNYKQKRDEWCNAVVDYMSENIIYSNSNLIAFNKPYGLSYSGNPKRIQIDRALQKLKARIAPKVERLHLVRSLDKSQSGIILFATSEKVQVEAKEMLKDSELVHRCIVYGSMDGPVEVTTPLVKKIIGQTVKLMPLSTNKTKDDVHYGTTLITPLATYQGVTLVSVATKNEIPHQLRCHLALAKVPLIGDGTYGGFKSKLRSSTIANTYLKEYPQNPWIKLDNKNYFHMPIFSHLQQMQLLFPSLRNKTDGIYAAVPDAFKWLAKRMHIFKR